MDLVIKTLDGGEAGKLKVSKAIFGLVPREDILQRVIRWQLARRQQGTHQSQGRSDVSRTGAKMFKQKDRSCSAFICSCFSVSRRW